MSWISKLTYTMRCIVEKGAFVLDSATYSFAMAVGSSVFQFAFISVFFVCVLLFDHDIFFAFNKLILSSQAGE